MSKIIFCGLALTFTGIFGQALALIGMDVVPGQPVLVITHPFGPPVGDVIRSAGLVEITPMSAPLGGLTQLENMQDVARLKQAGAFFVVDGKRVAEICGI